jgi:hypothetical protein
MDCERKEIKRRQQYRQSNETLLWQLRGSD